MNKFYRLTGVLFSALLVGNVPAAMAEYRDAIDLPSLQSSAAQHSLLLDVTRAGERLVSAGERGHILISDDQGNNWRQAEVPTRLQLNAVSFVDEEHGWAVGEDGVIVHSTDGGEHWQHQFDARDAGLKGPYLDVVFRNPQEGYAVGVFNKIVRTQDAGAHWDEWQHHVDNPDEWHFMAITATGPEADHLYIASEKGLVFRSLDGGQSFKPVQTGHDGTFHAVMAERGADGQDRIVVAGVGGVIYTSADNGESWHAIESGTEQGLSGAAWLHDGGLVLSGAGGVLVRLAPGLREAQVYATESGNSLSGLVAVNKGALVLVGFGGADAYNFNQ